MRDTAAARDAGFTPSAMTSHMEAIVILITSGKYIGYLPEHFARGFVAAGTMKSVLDSELAYHDTIHLVHRRDERRRSSMSLLSCLKDVLTAV
jgi:DNA-binding transcriptional LysR family regulator